MEESGCIPPCHINANEVEEKGLIDEPRHNPQTDLIIKVYNTKDFKVQSIVVETFQKKLSFLDGPRRLSGKQAQKVQHGHLNSSSFCFCMK